MIHVDARISQVILKSMPEEEEEEIVQEVAHILTVTSDWGLPGRIRIRAGFTTAPCARRMSVPVDVMSELVAEHGQIRR